MSTTIVPVFSCLLLVLGLSYLLQADNWIKLSRDVLANETRYYPLFLFLLVFGLVVIFEHNEWSMEWNIAITIFGWAMAIKSAVFLIAPRLMDPFSRLIELSLVRKWIQVAGVVLIAIGAVLVYQNVFNNRFGF